MKLVIKFKNGLSGAKIQNPGPMAYINYLRWELWRYNCKNIVGDYVVFFTFWSHWRKPLWPSPHFPIIPLFLEKTVWRCNLKFLFFYTVKNVDRPAILTIKNAIFRKKKIRIPAKIDDLRFFWHFLSRFSDRAHELAEKNSTGKIATNRKIFLNFY